MRRVFALALVLATMALTRHLTDDDVAHSAALATLAFGFLLLSAYLIGDTLARFGLPKITGYILAGILFGPHVLDLVTTSTVADLKLIDDLALTFIALAAGGELRLAQLRARRRAILFTVGLLTVIVFLGVAAFVLAARPLLPFLEGQRFVVCAVVAALMGTFAVARSPSSAIAIISECKARGPFTEMVLGVTVVMDVLVIIVFAAVVSVGQALVSPGGRLDVSFIVMVVVEIAGSIGVGLILGRAISAYITRVGSELAVFILAVAFLVTFASRQFAEHLDQAYEVRFHLEPMLICLTAGFWIQNFSTDGGVFMEKIDRSSLPIYIIFFSLTGAALDITSLRETWLVAILAVVVRAVLIWVGAYLGARLSGDPPRNRTLSGLSFITQAGVSLGLAGVVAHRFPEWGPALATTIVAIIALNQVIGPVGFRYALKAAGEDRGGQSRAGGPRNSSTGSTATIPEP
jgi:Kef-type K+ transport system membrane component KefB